MEKKDFMQDSDIDILGITGMDTDSKSEITTKEPLTESVEDPTIASMLNSEAMHDMFA